MTENLKSIVQAVNKCLKTDFNLISFDSQSDESLLQVLLDVFHKFDIITTKVRFFQFLNQNKFSIKSIANHINSIIKLIFIRPQWDVKENDPEETNKTIMECLIKIQYTDDSMDIGALRRGLVTGDKKVLIPIFEWVFENEDLIDKLAYLAR